MPLDWEYMTQRTSISQDYMYNIFEIKQYHIIDIQLTPTPTHSISKNQLHIIT